MKTIVQHLQNEIFKIQRASSQNQLNSNIFKNDFWLDVFAVQSVSLNSHSFYTFQNSWIADNEFNIHIINQQDWMLMFSSAHNVILTEDDESIVDSYSIFYVWLNSSTDLFHQLLIHTVYISDFHINLVSLSFAREAHIFFDIKLSNLWYQEKTLTTSLLIHHQWVLEWVQSRLIPSFFSSEPATNKEFNQIELFHATIKCLIFSKQSVETLNLSNIEDFLKDCLVIL